MARELVITLDEMTYERLQEQVGPTGISRFIEDAVRPHLEAPAAIEAGYEAMAEDAEREREATEWVEASIGDAGR